MGSFLELVRSQSKSRRNRGDKLTNLLHTIFIFTPDNLWLRGSNFSLTPPKVPAINAFLFISSNFWLYEMWAGPTPIVPVISSHQAAGLAENGNPFCVTSHQSYPSSAIIKTAVQGAHHIGQPFFHFSTPHSNYFTNEYDMLIE